MTVVEGGKMVVGERTVREEAKEEDVKDMSKESWIKRTVGRFLN